MRQCGHTLEAWGREMTSGFGKRIKECKLELRKLRGKTDGDPVEQFKAAKQKLFLILDQQEIFWSQRSKQLWLQVGDKNTHFFHVYASERRRSNSIQKLHNSEGEWVEWHNGLKVLITRSVERGNGGSALFQMHLDKSPGSDGMTPGFFQRHWSIVGSDIVELVRKFFKEGELDVGLNETNLVLIPKKKTRAK
ncbi:hypothetical protein AgCh_035608 [Apium graveolens]